MNNLNRAKEIRQLNRLSMQDLIDRGEGKLLVLDDLDALHSHLARSIASTVAANNELGQPTALILPYGPTGQYPPLKDILNREKISLKNAQLFFMDEYADAAGNVLAENHPLSFRGQLKWFWEALDPEIRPDASNVIFPDESNVDQLQGRIERAGGIEVCYGGVGIHGHLAFNEPEPKVRKTDARLVRLNDFSVTMNSIRSGVGGDLENFPRYAWTLGMTQCLSARRIELYCRNDISALDWANTVLRLALLGRPGDDYPVTWIREHPNWQVITDQCTAAPPKHLL